MSLNRVFLLCEEAWRDKSFENAKKKLRPEVHDIPEKVYTEALSKCVSKTDTKNYQLLLACIPMHLRNAPTALMKDLGYGEGYEYPHDAEDRFVATRNLPEELRTEGYYAPTEAGREAEIAKRLRDWRRKRR